MSETRGERMGEKVGMVKRMDEEKKRRLDPLVFLLLSGEILRGVYLSILYYTPPRRLLFTISRTGCRIDSPKRLYE